MMDLKTEYVTLTVDDGTSMRGYVAHPATPASRGVIVCQEAFGVNAHIRDVTERFARIGFLAIAPELFHRTAPGFEGRYDDFPSVRGHVRALSDDGMTADLRAAYAWLAANGGSADFPIAAVGFCMGGRAAVLTAMTVPVACAVSFYGGGIAPNANNPGLLNRVGELRAPLLLFWGGRDKHLGPDQIRAVTEALREAGKNYTNVEISDADHGFFCDARPSYNPVAAAHAWALVASFLDTYTSGRLTKPA
jgi:carboxymethylenebutenolidase